MDAATPQRNLSAARRAAGTSTLMTGWRLTKELSGLMYTFTLGDAYCSAVQGLERRASL